MKNLYFHATTADCAKQIKKTEFKCGTCGLFGPAIYFADNPISALIKSRIVNPTAVIVVHLNLGNMLIENGAHNNWNLSIIKEKGKDSIKTYRISGPEFIVYESWRISIIETYYLQVHCNIGSTTYFKYVSENNSSKTFEIWFRPQSIKSFSYSVECMIKTGYETKTLNGGCNIGNNHIFSDFTLF